MGYIYKIVCKDNNYFYIGSSSSKEGLRKQGHITDLRANRHSNKFIQNCYNKYGEDSLTWEIMQRDVPKEILLDVEDIWIGASCSVVNDGKFGMNVTNARRIKFKGIVYEPAVKPSHPKPEDKRRLHNPNNPRNSGKHHSNESKQKTSNKLKGQKHTSERTANKVRVMRENRIKRMSGSV